MWERINVFLEKTFKFLASLKLAIIVMSALTIMSAIGTIVEARYDAQYAQKLVYHSPLMYLIFALLCINLINVMVDRLPWKPHHAGFILAHVGIVLLIVGALVTKLKGIDGSLTFEIGQTNRYVMLPDTEVRVYASLGTGQTREIYRKPVDFLLRPPSEDKVELRLDNNKVLRVKDYYHYAVRETKIAETQNAADPVAIRIQLENPNINMTQWMFRPVNKGMELYNLGPARVLFVAPDYKHVYAGGNELLMRNLNDRELGYEIYTASKGGFTKKGKTTLGGIIETGWMGLKVRVLNYYPHAMEEVKYSKRERPTGTTTSAVLVEYGDANHPEEYWLGLNSNIRLLPDDMMYIFSFNNQLYDIGFDMRLDKFHVGRYQGTNRAMTYESEVTVPGLGQRKISMNEPLKHNDLTFYQASFQEDETGQPVASILSVNRDPGRPLKYGGSLLIVLGTVVMFWFKRYRAKIFAKITQSGAA